MDKEKKSFEILVRENSRMLTVFLATRIREQAVVDDLFHETMLVDTPIVKPAVIIK